MTYEQIQATCAAKGHAFFAGGPFDLNVFGVRAGRNVGDAFDDRLGCAYLDADGAPQLRLWPATTDPGLAHLLHPEFVEAIRNGTAFMAAGQYRSAYTPGWHGAGAIRHRALVQIQPVAAHRVKAETADIGDLRQYPITWGLYGLNIHRAEAQTPRVGRWSAGCQVFQRAADLDELLALCALQAQYSFGNACTYTLFNQVDFDA